MTLEEPDPPGASVTRPLQQALQIHFAKWLQANGFELVDQVYDAHSFGNEIITYRRPGLLLRFVSDRGGLYIDLSSDASDEDWVGFYNLLEVLGAAPKQVGWALKPQVKLFAELMPQHFEAALAMLQPSAIENTRNRIEEITRRRFDAMTAKAQTRFRLLDERSERSKRPINALAYSAFFILLVLVLSRCWSR